MKSQEVQKSNSGESSPKSEEQQEEVDVTPQNYEVKSASTEDFESTNAFEWTFLYTDDVPEQGLKATIVAPPFIKSEEDLDYSSDDEGLYLPLKVEDGSQRLFRLSDTRKYSLREHVGSDPQEMTGTQIRIEKEGMSQGVALKVTENLGTASKELLSYIRNEVEVVDPNYQEIKDLDSNRTFGDWGAKEVGGEK